MKQKVTRYIIGAFFFLFMCVTSCSIETDGSGGLEGYWHLVKVDTVETGGSYDLSEHLLFWSFQVHIMEGVDRQGMYSSILFRFEKDENLLRLYEPRLHDPAAGDPIIDDLSYLIPFGINDKEETYTIEQSSGSRMTLYNGILRLYFRKM